MDYGVIVQGTAAIYGHPSETIRVKDEILSSISDEGLYGMAVAVTGRGINGFYPVRTHYGYTGYMKSDDLKIITLKELKEWEHSSLMVIDAICADILSVPKVQGIRLAALGRGSLIEMIKTEVEVSGWVQVRLLDGTTGFIKKQYLIRKLYSQAGLWNTSLPQPVVLENQFRDAVVKTALGYLGVQYRWGGKSSVGIDCSGLTSMCYMINGVLIYRDAKLKEGYPVHEIKREQMKKGDLLYFPGHIALYMGDGRYIHSTGNNKKSGVMIQSLIPYDKDYRADLADSLYAVGSIF